MSFLGHQDQSSPCSHRRTWNVFFQQGSRRTCTSKQTSGWKSRRGETRVTGGEERVQGSLKGLQGGSAGEEGVRSL